MLVYFANALRGCVHVHDTAFLLSTLIKKVWGIAAFNWLVLQLSYESRACSLSTRPLQLVNGCSSTRV